MGSSVTPTDPIDNPGRLPLEETQRLNAVVHGPAVMPSNAPPSVAGQFHHVAMGRVP